MFSHDLRFRFLLCPKPVLPPSRLDRFAFAVPPDTGFCGTAEPSPGSGDSVCPNSCELTTAAAKSSSDTMLTLIGR